METKTAEIRPVILAGGSGKRLWPKSRASFPKQFTDLIGDETLFQSAVLRVCGVGFSAPVVVTAEPFRFIVLEQLEAIGVKAAAILIESEGKNTAPAVAAALAWIEVNDANARVLVTPSDHIIEEADTFRRTVLSVSSDPRILTFGVRPTRPETGYGWIERMDDTKATPPYAVKRFVEKPNVDDARSMLEERRYLWNAGIFLSSARALREAFEAASPSTLTKAREAFSKARMDLGFCRLDPAAWARLDPISIDHAVMEHTSDMGVVPWDEGWSDLGSWDAIWRASGAETVCNGTSVALDCENSYLSSPEGQRLVGIGLRNVVAVALPDAVLVTTLDAAQNVAQAVEALAMDGVTQAVEFPRDHRPWGWFETLAFDGRFRVKRIVVKPGGRLSLQSHQKRAEHWVVVEGTAQVTIGENRRRLSENQSIYVPVGVRHRLENEGDSNLVLIEVQTGGYLGEDDIKRFEDAYRRE